MSKFLLNLLLQISKALVNSIIQFLIQKFFFPYFGQADLAAHSASGPASPLVALPPQAKTVSAGPSSPRVFTGNTFSFLVRAFRADRLSLVSLSTGPQLSDPPPSSHWPTRSTPPPRLAAIDRPAPPGLHHCGANQSPLLPRLDFPF
jgi:hypothetical protein